MFFFLLWNAVLRTAFGPPSPLAYFFTLRCKGPKLESESLYLYSCNASPQLWFKLLGQPRASTQGVKIDWRVHRKHSVYVNHWRSTSTPQTFSWSMSTILLFSTWLTSTTAFFYWSTSTCLFQPAFFCWPTSTCLFLTGRRPSTSILQPFSSRPTLNIMLHQTFCNLSFLIILFNIFWNLVHPIGFTFFSETL